MKKFALLVAMTGQRRFIAFLASVLYVLCWPVSTPSPIYAQKIVATTNSAQESGPARNDIKFDRIGLEQGLSHNTVWCLLQDRKGFMWFGTEDGLNKYDGYSFKAYRHDPDDPKSLSHNIVTSLFEDREGFLWIGTDGGGLNRFDRKQETFARYRHEPENPTSLSSDWIRPIFEDHTGALWVGTLEGLNKFDRQNETFTHYKHHRQNPASLSHNHILRFYENRRGELFIATGGGGYNKLNRENETFIRYQHNLNDRNSLSGNSVYGFCEDRFGNFWVGTVKGGLNKLVADYHDGTPARFEHYLHNPEDLNSLSSNEIRAIHEDRAGTLWIGTDGGGLNKLVDSHDKVSVQQASAKFIHYKNDPDNPNSLSNNSADAIFEDRTGGLWIRTWGAGVNKFNLEQQDFAHYQSDASNAKSRTGNEVRAIFEDHAGALWVGTERAGLFRMNRGERNAAAFTYGKHAAGIPESLMQSEVLSIHEDRSSVLWIGTRSDGLIRFDSERQKAKRYAANLDNPTTVSRNTIRVIYESGPAWNGALWIGTRWGLSQFNRDDETFIRYPRDQNNPPSLSHSEVRAILEDRSGALWIGTYGGGVNKLLPNENGESPSAFINYRHEPDNPNSLSHNMVIAIHEDQSGRLWFGTLGGGLNRFDREREAFICYREKNGLPSNIIYGILEDERSHLWLSTNKGLSKFDPATETFRNYDVRDGLQSNQFGEGAYHKSRSGEMFFGGINGFNAFHPDSIKDNPHLPPVVITDFQIFNKSVPLKRDSLEERAGSFFLDKHISESETITLSYRERVFSFEFAALHFSAPEKNQYAYMMEGFDADWNHVGNRRLATYTNLDPGDYVFRVKGSNKDGIWNEAGASIKITITPPWWKTWWSYAFYVIIGVAALYALRSYELNRQRLKHDLQIEHVQAEKLHELDRLKSRFFVNISHEFRTPLTLILGPIENLRQRLADESAQQELSMMQRNGQRLLRLINQLLDLSRLEAGKLKLEARPGDLLVFLKGIVFSFESLAKQRGIALQFQPPENLLPVCFDADKLEKVLVNLLSNAFKFTAERGKISVQLSVSSNQLSVISKQSLHDQLLTDHCLLITVRDTGSGIGLALTKELVELHHGEISVASEVGKGTAFTVRLPLVPVSSDQLPVISYQ